MTMPHDTIKSSLLDAALAHVPFDGWSDATFRAAVQDSGVDPVLADSLCPRGAVDLALAYHARGDDLMMQRLRAEDLSGLRFRDHVAAAVRFRIEAVDDKEAVRRGTTLFALPMHAADGARAIWGTCDLIWTALGDDSEDGNWYTKRALLSAVYTATILYWLGDETEGNRATWEFLDRRIDNVMQIEKLKSSVRANPLLKPLLIGPDWLMGRIRAPVKMPDVDLPGMMNPRR